ncbi:hypothetical protein Tco_0941586 [Tanacetum coccineum]|uniref:Uncharacterized protein n=1 Tax=Tanacetum coccineum TaxID=301880 RepID=A0ABQ5DRB3_9ASTR
MILKPCQVRLHIHHRVRFYIHHRVRSCCYMAERKVGRDVVEDLTRESLIALSYSLLDFDLPPTEFPKNVKSVTEAVNTDEKDIVRCNMISISYAESPDTKNSLVSPVM